MESKRRSRSRNKVAFEEEREELDERVVDITRVAKVVKGGRSFGFRVTAVVGDNKGQIGFGIGRARTVPEAIAKEEHACYFARLPKELVLLLVAVFVWSWVLLVFTMS